MRATSMKSKTACRFRWLVAVENIEVHTATGFLRRRRNQGSNRLGGLAVFADDLTDVAFCHTKLDERVRAIFDLPHLNRVRFIDKRAGNRSYKFFHDLPALPRPSRVQVEAALFLRSLFTVREA